MKPSDLIRIRRNDKKHDQTSEIPTEQIHQMKEWDKKSCACDVVPVLDLVDFLSYLLVLKILTCTVTGFSEQRTQDFKIQCNKAYWKFVEPKIHTEKKTDSKFLFMFFFLL